MVPHDTSEAGALQDRLNTGLGTFEGTAAIRSSLEGWVAAYEEYEEAIVESRDLGSGVAFTVVRFDGRPAGRVARVRREGRSAQSRGARVSNGVLADGAWG